MMRDLTAAELELISGGYDGNSEDIVVTGTPYPPSYPPYVYPPGNYYPSPPGTPGYGSGPAPSDEAIHQVTTGVLDHALTAPEQELITNLNNSIAKVGAWVANIPSNAYVLLENGDLVTGAEVKAAWAKTDFVVNKTGYVYNAGTPQASTNSEARWNNGDPVVSINLNMLNDYNLHDGGMDYLVLHEVAHLTPDQRFDYTNKLNGGYTSAEALSHERMASDVARAVVLWNKGVVMDPKDATRYTTEFERVFRQTPK